MFDTGLVCHEPKIINAHLLTAKDRDEEAIAEIWVYAATRNDGAVHRVERGNESGFPAEQIVISEVSYSASKSGLVHRLTFDSGEIPDSRG